MTFISRRVQVVSFSKVKRAFTTRARRCVMATMAATLSFSVQALGLGDVQLQSKLNEPFSATINILSASAAEIGSLRVGLAGAEDWQRAGLSPQSAASQLRFGFVATGGGNLMITLSTDEPVREPLLMFLVDAAWDSGHLLREYTVFLDPDSLPSNQTAPVMLPQTGSAAGSQTSYGSSTQKLSTADLWGQNYGPVRSGDNLSKIAERLIAGTDLSRYQMVWALFQINQSAFTSQNINLLNSGVNLRVPEFNEAAAISPLRAKQLVKAAAAKSQAESRNDSTPSGRVEPKESTANQNQANRVSKRSAADEGADNGSNLANAASAENASDNAADSNDAAVEPGLSNLAAGKPAPKSVDKLELLPLENPDRDLNASNDAVATPDSATSVENSGDFNRGAEAAASGDSGNTRESALAAENNLLRERISETEALLKEIRSLLAARSEQLSDLQLRLERVETSSSNSATQATVQHNQPIGWFWWLLLLVAVLILLALIALLLLLTKRNNNKSEASERLDAFEAELNAADHHSASHKTTASTRKLVSEAPEEFDTRNSAPKPESEVPDHLAKAMTAAPVMAKAVHSDTDDEELAPAPPPGPETVTESELALDERESVDDEPLAFDVGNYSADQEEASPTTEQSDAENIELPAIEGFDDISTAEFDIDELQASEQAPDMLDADALEFEAVEPVEAGFDDDFADIELPESDVAGSAGDVIENEFEAIDEATPLPVADLETDDSLDAPLLVGSPVNNNDVADSEIDDAQSLGATSSVDVSDFSGGDQVATKLDLARVYADMGDAEEAQSILDEVLRDGDDAQKSEAQNIIDSLV